jgi:Protein of unknown function (DUF4058)
MKSPFPGMDPFIEAGDYWGDFHDKLIGEIERDISARIPDRYVVRLAKRSYIELADDWPVSPYYLLVARRQVLDQGLVWPAFSVRPLPQIPVPLLPADPDLHLSLQPMVDAIYRRSRYDIDYARSASLPLSAEERALISPARKSPKRSHRNP